MGLKRCQVSTGEGSASKLTQVSVGRIQLLKACWTEDLVPSWLFLTGELLYWAAPMYNWLPSEQARGERR